MAAAIAEIRRAAAARIRLSPAAVAAISTARPSVGSGRLSASPAPASPSTTLVIVGPATRSAAASAPSDCGPANTTTDKAESLAGVSPASLSTAAKPRSRWIAPEFSAAATCLVSGWLWKCTR